MLINNEGKRVQVRFDAKPHALVNLREVFDPGNNTCGNVFNLEQRARIIDKR